MKKIAIWCLALISMVASGQELNERSVIKKVTLHIDTIQYSFDNNSIWIENKRYLAFSFTKADEVCEVELKPSFDNQLQNIKLVPSADFRIIDSAYLDNQGNYIFKIQFQNIFNSDFIKFLFSVQIHDSTYFEVVRLFPYTFTAININPLENELFIGEEKMFELITNFPHNVVIHTDWKTSQNIDYRFSEKYGQIYLHLLPKSVGNARIEIPLNCHVPDLKKGKPVYQVEPLRYEFYVKKSRLKYLNVDQQEVTLDEDGRKQGTEIQIDNSPLLLLEKTYRVEEQEERGGALIAEIYTKRYMANDRVLCNLRTYENHKKSNGYLYIKDGDKALFITNFTISPKTSINSIKILRQGERWTNNLNVFPGENIDIRIEGEGLHKARFFFDGAEDITSDTIKRNEDFIEFKLRIPVNISKKNIELYNYSHPTGYALSVKEYQEPRPFDFIFVNYGGLNRSLSSLREPVLYEKTIKDVVFSFNNERIDADEKLYGKQYLKIDVQITDHRNELVEMKTINNIVVCPGDNSPRIEYYDTRDCRTEELSLNKYIRKQTYNLDDWSKINLTISHMPEKYEGESQKKEMEIILKKAYKFDLDVSFPAGLITVYREGDGTKDSIAYGNLGGISMAMIAQFSFYHPDKIAVLKPYRIGAGFIALNAFNFSSKSSNQDIGIVVLGSLYPTKKETKFSFPLYLGGGYFLKGKRWMFMIGPGIRVSL